MPDEVPNVGIALTVSTNGEGANTEGLSEPFSDTSCALLIGGRVHCWGSARGYKNCELTSNHFPDCEGTLAELNDNTAVEVAVGYGYACAVLSSGTVQCWGKNRFGILGEGEDLEGSKPAETFREVEEEHMEPEQFIGYERTYSEEPIFVGPFPSAEEAPPRSRPVQLRNIRRPTITGKAKVGTKLYASPGTWSGKRPVVYAYQWEKCSVKTRRCVALPKFKKSHLKFSPAYRGSILLRVTVTASTIGPESGKSHSRERLIVIRGR